MSLFDSNNKGVKFTTIGDQITGTIAGDPYERQQTKFGTQDPDFWPNGDPKMQVLVPLQTQLREDSNDDGERTLYVASKNLKNAIGDAIRTAGVGDVARGGVLTIKYIGNDPASKNPANPAKQYAATYTPPATGLAAPAAQPQQVAPAPIPQAPQPVTPVGNGLTPDQVQKIAQLRAAGIDDVTIATAVQVSPDLLAATPF